MLRSDIVEPMNPVVRAMAGSSRPSQEKRASRLPAPGERAIVRCPGFRCLAYRDGKGKWRSTHGGRELPEVLEVVLPL
jgi:hypothetical protein